MPGNNRNEAGNDLTFDSSLGEFKKSASYLVE